MRPSPTFPYLGRGGRVESCRCAHPPQELPPHFPKSPRASFAPLGTPTSSSAPLTHVPSSSSLRSGCPRRHHASPVPGGRGSRRAGILDQSPTSTCRSSPPCSKYHPFQPPPSPGTQGTPQFHPPRLTQPRPTPRAELYSAPPRLFPPLGTMKLNNRFMPPPCPSPPHHIPDTPR